MRFAASPLMVAVALGLLGPSVLEAEEEGLEEHAFPDGKSEACSEDRSSSEDAE